MFEHVKAKLQEAGEVMIFTDAGEQHELHSHNVTFHDDSRLIEVDTAEEVHWLDGDKIERFWIHREF